MLPPRAVELWSYLIGLGRVGQPVAAPNAQICEDLNIRLANQVPQIMSRLIAYGAIRRDGIGLYTVLKRIGHEGEPPRKEPRFMLGKKHFQLPEYSHSKALRKAKLEEIPDDTRDLTGRLFNDPIPGDPRRPWQGAAV